MYGSNSAKLAIVDFTSADTYLGKKNDRPLPGKNTRLIRLNPDKIVVQYQSTYVVTYLRDGEVQLYTGGWNTKTTRSKFSEFTSKLSTWSRDGQLLVDVKGSEAPPMVMQDRATLKADGTLVTDCNEQAVVELKRLRKLTADYSKAYVELFVEGDELRECAVCNKVEPTVSRSWQSQQAQAPQGTAEVHMDRAHIIEHMEQKQYPDALLQCAVNCFGSEWHHRLFNKGVTQGLADYDQRLVRRDFPSVLRRFLRRELGLECSK